MRKLVLLAALLAMLLGAALPALAADDRGNGDRNDNNHRDNNNNGGGDPAITQESEQETESGDVDQSFTVSNTGDNSNQCAGIQGVAQTGNDQNEISLTEYRSRTDEFNFDEVGSSIEASPKNSTGCEQGVDQAASASGDNLGTGGYPVKKKQ